MIERDGDTYVGLWESNDDREWYKFIHVGVTDEGRFSPYVPYWSGFPEPEFGHIPTWEFPRSGTLKQAIAVCETYLAKDHQDW
jgi:hypothetical protein